MTREEAIKILKFERGYICDFKGCQEQQAFTMAIKALEQQNELFKMGLLKDCESCKAQSINFMCCDDVISREKAKQFLYERLDRFNNDELYDIFSRIINDMCNELPSVTPTQRWIPVSSDKLPDMDEEVLVDDGLDMFVAWWVDDGYEARWHSLDGTYSLDSPILAWMPLPQPYKAEMESEE